jgi:hypothetical protein
MPKKFLVAFGLSLEVAKWFEHLYARLHKRNLDKVESCEMMWTLSPTPRMLKVERIENRQLLLAATDSALLNVIDHKLKHNKWHDDSAIFLWRSKMRTAEKKDKTKHELNQDSNRKKWAINIPDRMSGKIVVGELSNKYRRLSYDILADSVHFTSNKARWLCYIRANLRKLQWRRKRRTQKIENAVRLFWHPENGQNDVLGYNKRTKITGQNNLLGFNGVQK